METIYNRLPEDKIELLHNFSKESPYLGLELIQWFKNNQYNHRAPIWLIVRAANIWDLTTIECFHFILYLK